MSNVIIWLCVGIGLYWAYCIFWGVKGMLQTKTAQDYFIAGRQLPMWVFVLAATATSFSGWTFVGHPGSVFKSGLPYLFASFYAITIPFSGVLFLKRQWILGKKYDFVTPGEMFSYYYGTDVMRVLTVLVALFFSIPYLAVQLKACGFLFYQLTDHQVPLFTGAILLSLVVVFYVAAGGLRSVAWVDCLQCVLLVGGIVVMGIVAVVAMGGWESFLGQLTAFEGKEQAGSSYLNIPTKPESTNFLERMGVLHVVKKGGPWTGLMILTYMFALMGIQSAPAFSMWAFSNKDPRPFPWQQVVASSLIVGFVLFTFTAFQGLGGKMMVASGDLKLEEDITLVMKDETTIKGVLHAQTDTEYLIDKDFGRQLILKSDVAEAMPVVPKSDTLVAAMMQQFLQGSTGKVILLVLVAVAALAAMQSTGAAYMSTGGAMVTRDVYLRYLKPDASHRDQLLLGRLSVVGITAAAFLVSIVSRDNIVLLGGLAVSFGFQMYPSLIGVLFWRRLTPAGVSAGLIAGLIAVAVTYVIPGFRYPLTIHCAGWGILANALVTILVSLLGPQPSAELKQRMDQMHDYLKRVAGVPKERRHWKPIAWIFTIVWFLFAIGPFAVIGNTWLSKLFAERPSWALPDLWMWQLVWWAFGVVMMWLLAFKLQMSTHLDKERLAQVE